MAMPKAGVSLVVENDQQFKAALSEVNAGLRVNKQQMQLVTEQTREMDDRQAALQQRYEAAQQTLQSYRDKVQVLQQAYENSARREGEASKTTMEWRASLISAQTEVAKQESLLRDLSSGQETARRPPPAWRMWSTAWPMRWESVCRPACRPRLTSWTASRPAVQLR